MGFKFYAFLFIALYLLLMIAVGLWYGRRESDQDFIIGNRNIGIIPTAASLAASFRDGGGIVFWISAGFAASYGGMWLLGGVILSAILLAFLGPRLRAEAKAQNHITIQERVRDVIGLRSARLASAVSMIFGLLIIALQFHVSGNIFAQILDVPKYAGVVVVGTILAVYLIAGGYKSVIVTDTIQFFIMFSLIVIPFLLAPASSDMFNVSSLFDIPRMDGIALFLFGIYYLIIAPESWQRIFSARDERTIRIGIPLTALILIVMTFSLIWLGMGLKQIYPGIEKATLYATMFRDNPAVSPWLLGYILLVFLSITMSTQSAACYGFVSTLGKVFMPGKTEKSRDYILFSRKWMAAALVLAGIMSLTISKVVEYMFDIVGFVICLGPTYLLAAVAPQLDGYKALSSARRETFDKAVAGTTLLGITVFFACVILGVTDGGFIYSVLPGVGTTLLAGLVAFGVLRRPA